jgi:cell division protein FtsN
MPVVLVVLVVQGLLYWLCQHLSIQVLKLAEQYQIRQQHRDKQLLPGKPQEVILYNYFK